MICVLRNEKNRSATCTGIQRYCRADATLATPRNFGFVFASQAHSHFLPHFLQFFLPSSAFPSSPSPSTMSQSQDIQRADSHLDVAPTPQNTPLETGVLQNRPANLGQPTVETLQEGEESEEDEEVGGANPASLLAQVSFPPDCLMWGGFRFRLQKGGEAEWR